MKLFEQMKKRLNNLSIRKKLLISYILVVLMPVLIVGLVLTNGMRRITLDRAIQEATVNVDRIEKSVADILKIAVDLSNKIYTDKKFEAFVSKKYESTLDVVEAYRAYTEFDQYKLLYNEIQIIRFYSYNETILENGQIMRVTGDVKKAAWYKNAVLNDGRVSWNYVQNPMDIRKSYTLSLSRLVKNINGKKLGVLMIGIKNERLNYILKEEPFDTMIINDEGYVIAAKDANIVGRRSMRNELDSIERGILDDVYNGRVSKVIVNTLVPKGTNNKLKIVSVFPVGVIVREANEVSLLGFLIILLSFLLATMLIYVFSRILSKRVSILSGDIHRVARGDFDVESAIDGEDEIGQLSQDFNIMVRSIKQLIHEVYEINMQKNQLVIKQKEIKFQMLANQINPHFLFNSLETIRMKAHCSGQEEIAEVVKLLGRIMRRNLEAGNEPVDFEKELELVKGYLQIQKFRFGDKINYHINIPDNYLDYPILPLIIQPVVENAVVHGLEGKTGPGVVDISLLRNKDSIIICVKDNGLGMDEKTLLKLRESLGRQEDNLINKIGLRNVHQRIKFYYGEAYGLDIHSKANEGTKVNIILPERYDTYV